MNKTKILVFEHRKSTTPAFLYGGKDIEQVDEFKYLGMLMHGTKDLSPAIDLLCRAARRAMFGLQRRCQQLSIHDPVLKCKLFDTLLRPILCYCCEIWYVLGGKAALDDLERIEIGFLKVSAWGSGPYKDTPCIGRIWEVLIACDMAIPSCKLPEQAGANATGKDPQTGFQC